MLAQHQGEICFVITPAGDEGSDVQRDSDRVLDEIVRPAVEKFGYHIVRSDKLRTPASVHKDGLLQLADAPLVIANLTGKNAHVFYQLAFCHTIEKPVILICAKGEELPFDSAIYNVLRFDLCDSESMARCTENIIQRIEANDGLFTSDDHPLSKLIDLQQLRSNMAFTAADVRKAFEKVPDLAHFRNYSDDLRILIQRLRQNNIKTKGQLAELLSRGILDTIRTLYREELYRREDHLLDPEGVAVWGSYFLHRGVTLDNMARVRKVMAGFPEYQKTHGDLVILQARYGADSTWCDVSDILRSEIRDSRLELNVSNDTFRRRSDPVKWDPCAGIQKRLEVHYTYKNQPLFKAYLEGEKLELPVSQR